MSRDLRPTERARGCPDDRHADLHGGEEPFRIVTELLDDTRAPPSLFDEADQTRAIELDDGDLGAGEHAVDEDEGEDDAELDEHPSCVAPPPGGCKVPSPAKAARARCAARRDRVSPP